VPATEAQLELGSQATSYAAYFEPIELCKIGTYQDSIYKNGGKWYLYKKIQKTTFDSDTGWSWDSSVPRVSRSITDLHIILPPNVQTNAYGYSNKYISGSFEHVYTNKNNGFALSPSGYLSCVDKSWTTEAQAKSTIAGTTFYFAVQEPYATTTEITNEALIEQLDAILNSGRVYEGTNNITTVIAAGNAKGEVQVSYYTHQDPSTRDEIIIDSRLRTITLNGLDIYDKKTEGSDFLMLVPGENKLILQSDIEGDNGYAEVNYKQGYLSI
jgi:hypothetical protein